MNLSRAVLTLLVIPATLAPLGCAEDNNATATDSGASTGVTATVTDGTSSTTVQPTTSVSATGTTDGSGGNSDSVTGSTSVATDPTAGTTTTGNETTADITATDTTQGVDSTTGGTTTGGTTIEGTTADGTTGGSSSTGLPVDCEPGDTMGMGGDVEKSYLWVANTNEGSVSKVDTQTMIELARYRTGPLGGSESPSRTAVSFDGKYVIVNGRQSGRSTVIAANLEDCVDKNGNGMIDTSLNKADLRAWDADECKIWSIVHPVKPGDIGAGPRGVTWTPGIWDVNTCTFKDPKVWVGYLPIGNAIAHMVRLNGLTGAVEETVAINNWVAGWANYGPYGAALDKSFNVWFTGLRGELFRINTANNPATFDRWAQAQSVQSYGMTVDPDGDPWMAGCSGPVTTFEPLLNKTTSIANTNACYRGIAADHDGSVWVASNGPCGVAQIDHKTNTLIKFHNLAQCSTPVGVSVDTEGFVWLVDQAGWAWKIDPANPGGMKKVDILGDHYTYSDMTGGQLKSVILPQ
ncbi:MAG: lyase [Nannocystis sp.]|nr:lyase [Nannocystis sp.]MBA3549160.1 lyase [Nannocystis sp.]